MDSPSTRRDVTRPPPIVCISLAVASEPMISSRFAWRETKELEYRHERTSSSSSDSGVGVQFSPLIGGTSIVPGQSPTLSAFSPPGLSPLTIHDSAFSTPTTTSTNRFTFDHVPFSRSEKSNLGSAFDVPTTSKENLRDVLASVRHEGNSHAPLQRKESVIQSTRGLALGSVLSDPQQLGKLTVTVPDASLDQFKGLLGNLYQPNGHHNLLAPSLSSDAVLHSPLQVSPLSEKSPLSGASTETLDDLGDNKQYYCHICKKDFKRPDILSRHLRRHTGEKPFGCESCGRFFSRSDHLRTHRRTHTDEKPYHCDVCPYSARRRDVLTRHMNTRHQQKASPSVFQRHREVRRCLSDGDPLLNPKLSPSPSGTPKRIRHSTDIQTGGIPRNRTLTELPTSAPIQEADDSFPSLAEIEDDVIVDVEDGEEEEEDEA